MRLLKFHPMPGRDEIRFSGLDVECVDCRPSKAIRLNLWETDGPVHRLSVCIVATVHDVPLILIIGSKISCEYLCQAMSSSATAGFYSYKFYVRI